MASLEREILAQARIKLNNPKLKMKQILEWSTGEVKAQPGETVIRLKNPGCNVCVHSVNDKRK